MKGPASWTWPAGCSLLMPELGLGSVRVKFG